MKNIYYIVRIKEEYINNLRCTTINHEFCGKYIKAEYGNVYFSLNGSGANIIIPEEYIEFCVPSKVLWNRTEVE